MGDTHQPLHCVTRYTESNPNGDYGGNIFFIKNIDGLNNLHSLWDSVLTDYTYRYSGVKIFNILNLYSL